MAEVMKITATFFKRPHAYTLHSVPPALQQATADPHLHRRLLVTHGHVWVRLLWAHCPSLLGPGTQGSVCARQESVSQSYVSSGDPVVGLMVTDPKRAHTIPRSTAPRAPAPVAGLC